MLQPKNTLKNHMIGSLDYPVIQSHFTPSHNIVLVILKGLSQSQSSN